ncbi:MULTISPECIES: cupin domain-containing protein [Bradyrhizobium]|uniref:cupin domain-containing protein n=1 Tax=Bradyrhizobium TaxID=374 RepID=UPI0009D92E8E|nr:MULTISPECIES: cupin domain-containing protein [Bradyrhizobium]MCA1530474.1 cupin domain-containing protein [Bradyrhizobium yuanmingense]
MKQDYLNESRSDASKSLSNASSGLNVENVTIAKKVTKGWGEERWLVAEGAPFGFKLIHIQAGRKTSLQYHEHKEEANLVLSGSGILFYGRERRIGCLKKIDLRAGDIVHIMPGMVHRIEAKDDITLVEVSTPELDDVVRLEDDWHRGNGRIESEHSSER